MSRKVIQITNALDSDGDAVIHALCDDGSIWARCFMKGGGLYWEQIDGVDDLLNIDTEEKAISFAKEWNLESKNKLDAIAKNEEGVWYGFAGNVKLVKSEDGEKWECDDRFSRLNTLLKKRKAKKNGELKSWKESLIIFNDVVK